MTTCTHEFIEQEIAVVDGKCPLCMAVRLEALERLMAAADAMRPFAQIEGCQSCADKTREYDAARRDVPE